MFSLMFLLFICSKSVQQQQQLNSKCLDKFDIGLKRQCMRGEWTEKYYFELNTRKCTLFWYDGCPSSSQNFFNSLIECQRLCESAQLEEKKSCFEKFDDHLLDECIQDDWKRKYYFDRKRLRCVSFWYGGCESESKNVFEDINMCLNECDANNALNPANNLNKKSELNWIRPTTEATYGVRERINSQVSIHINPTNCNNQFVTANIAVKNPTTRIISHPHRQHYYPNKQQKIEQKQLVTASHLINQNKKIINEKENENNKKYLEKNQKITKNHFSLKSKISTNLQIKNDENLLNNLKQPLHQQLNELTNLCDSQSTNPCENNGTCLWNENTGKYFCKCTDGYFSENCSRKIGLNPCAQSPCQNGATCSVIGEAEHVDFDCFCTSGYAGKSCEFRPCDQNPCKNGGICRTTRSAALFFCACSPSWGGKTCLIALPPIEDDDEYWEATALDANFTQQLSSGKVEWIEQLKKITPTTSNETEITTNLFEQAIGEELPIRALKNSTSKNAAISRYINKEKIEIFLVLLIVLIISLF